jgi:DNA-binding GntR family transcriptional regulator
MVERTVKARAMSQLIAKFIAGELATDGRLSEVQLSRELGMSRGPIREALNLLASRGWIELVPGLGAFVRIPTKRDLRELYDCRQALECLAVELAIPRISRRQCDALASSIETLRRVHARTLAEGLDDFDEQAAIDWMDADLQFHETIIEAADNQALSRALASQHVMLRAFSQRADCSRYPVGRLMQRTLDEHAAVLAGMLARDRAAATHAMRTHIRRTARCMVRQYTPQRMEHLRFPAAAVKRLVVFEANLGG